MSNWLRRKSLFYTKPVKASAQPRRFHPLRILGQAIKRTCMVIGAVVLFSVIVTVWSASSGMKEPAPSLPNKMVLFLKLDDKLPEKRGAQDYFSQFGLAPEPVTVSDITNALDRAAHDDRVKGFVLSLRSAQFEIAQLQELRAAVLKFKASGKFTKVYAPSYGEGGSGLGMYYLASAFNEIWMQPVGVVSIAGLDAQMPYFKNILEKYGVKAQFFQRKEYKNAMENLTANEMSPASREMMTVLIGDLGNQISTGIASSRKKVSQNIGALINQGLFTDDEALKAGLIDRLDYGDVLLSELRLELDGSEDAKKTGFTDIEEYVRDEKLPNASRGRVAVVYVQGMIMDGGGPSPLAVNEKAADASELAQAIRDAATDKSIDTIVVRINSPGGSPSASESIRRAIVWAKEKKHKPVIVSMGATAASGGYWIAANADKIYADGATLTGSIGVLGGKFDLSGLFAKYDVNWDGVTYGKNAGMWAMNHGFNASEQERFEASLDSVYNHFISIVSKGRKMKPEQVEAIAKGRVWSGRQALQNGLVDRLGGFDMAMDDIAKSKNLESRHKLTIVELPAPENPLQELYDMLQKKSPFGASIAGGLPGQVSAFLPLLDNNRLVYAPMPSL